MAKRQTIGENPLDTMIPPSNNGSATAVLEAEEAASQQRQPTQKQSKSSKQRITVQISENVIERLKNAVYWTPGLTLASLAEDAFSKAVDALETERETPFPKRTKELTTGRPMNPMRD